MTIAKVELTKAELDFSLFEYEQHKMQKKSSSEQHANTMEKIKNSSSSESRSILVTRIFAGIDEIENDFARFSSSTLGSHDVDGLDKAQIKLRAVLSSKTSSLTRDEIKALRLNLNQELSAKLNESSLEKQSFLRMGQPVSLSSIYKWEQVDSRASDDCSNRITEEQSVRKDFEIDEEMTVDQKIDIYTKAYCNYYLKHFSRIFFTNANNK